MNTPLSAVPFEFDSYSVRVIDRDGEIWFVASDVCQALGLPDTHKAVARLDSDEKDRNSIPTLGGDQQMTIISEPGLYRITMTSRKPAAKRFTRWVTHEVLPAIRKYGHYHDTDNTMGALVTDTIGTDGHQLLGAVIKTKVAALPKEVRRKATTKLWSQIHTAFQVRTAADIPADQLDSARNFIAAYALDGEFLPKVRGEEAIISLDIYDAHNLYRLLSRIVSLNKYRERIGTLAKATDSMPLKDLYSQLQESQLTYRQLDRKLGAQLLQAHRALGCNSGSREAPVVL